MKKIRPYLVTGVLLFPILLLILVVLYQVVGMAVNHAASARQTANLVRLLEEELPQVEILDRRTETGNTSGTGNHVDMLSVITFQTQDDLSQLRQLLDQRYGPDTWSLEEQEDGCRLSLNTSAPFPNNIEGH